MLALDECDAHLELRRPDGGDVAARPGAEHDEVELFGHHAASFLSASARSASPLTRMCVHPSRGTAPMAR